MDKIERKQLENECDKIREELKVREAMVAKSRKLLEEKGAERRKEIRAFMDELREYAKGEFAADASIPSVGGALESIILRFSRSSEYVYVGFDTAFADVLNGYWSQFDYLRICKDHSGLEGFEDALFKNKTLIKPPPYSDCSDIVMRETWVIMACFYLASGKNIDKAIAKFKQYIESARWEKCYDDAASDEDIDIEVFGEDLYKAYLASDYCT